MDSQQIKLTNQQQLIFKLLIQYRNQMNLKTVMRVAGGWVRDKLMAKQSKDIDIALDNISGQQFIKLLKQIAQNKKDQISGYGVTKANPQLSKHLQTATAKIHGQWIDFVNLRSNIEQKDKCIYGSPKQDAYLRDFTINSMFYNIDSRKIQDYTQLGVQDLQNKMIRTPLDPKLTFKDDPLRILRCFRFQSRFGFTIDDKIMRCIQMDEFKKQLKDKVSRQRIGLQLTGILKSKQPLLGLNSIRANNIWQIIFPLPENTDFKDQKQISQIANNSFLVCKKLVSVLQKQQWITQKYFIKNHQDQKNNAILSKKKLQYFQSKQIYMLLLLASITIIYVQHHVQVGKSIISLIQYFIKQQLKLSCKISKFVNHLCQSAHKLNNIRVQKQHELIKWIRYAGQKWQIAIFLKWCVDQAFIQQRVNDPLKLKEYILVKKLDECWLINAPIDGKQLIKKGIKGASIGTVLENAAIWQIINSQKTKQQFWIEFIQNMDKFKDSNMYD